MRQLRFVRSGGDSDHIVLVAADTEEQFLLPVTTQLRDAVRSDLPRLYPEQAPAVDPLSPREIQTRVRAGESPQRLAADADMSLERVMRFAGPVLAERARIAEEARRGRARRTSDYDASAAADAHLVVFGEAVDARFTAHGLDPAKVSWDARRREDGSWVVSARWVGGKAERSAEWLFQIASRSVTALDETAADLLSERPIRAVVAALPSRTPDVPTRTPGVVVFPAAPDARTGPLPALTDDFELDPGLDPDFEGDGDRGDAPHDVTHDDLADRGQEVGDPFGEDAGESGATQPLPLPLLGEFASESEPQSRAGRPLLGSGHRRTLSDEERAARTRIPSWDDIMLGVQRRPD